MEILFFCFIHPTFSGPSLFLKDTPRPEQFFHPWEPPSRPFHLYADIPVHLNLKLRWYLPAAWTAPNNSTAVVWIPPSDEKLPVSFLPLFFWLTPARRSCVNCLLTWNSLTAHSPCNWIFISWGQFKMGVGDWGVGSLIKLTLGSGKKHGTSAGEPERIK